MITEFVNGYNVTGNHGTGSERLYHVCDAAGKVLLRCAGKVLAISNAKWRPTGDVPDPTPEPVPEPVPLKVVTPPPQKPTPPPNRETRDGAIPRRPNRNRPIA